MTLFKHITSFVKNIASILKKFMKEYKECVRMSNLTGFDHGQILKETATHSYV